MTISFNVSDKAVLAELQTISTTLTQILERLMSTMPVSQATFDTALAAVLAALTTLSATEQSVATGLAAVEAALVAAQGSSTPVDLSAELASVQSMQAQIASDQAVAAAAVASLPTTTTPPTT